MPDPYPQAGAELRRLRLARGLTQDQLAERARLSSRTVRNLEHGRRQPHPHTIGLLAAALETDPARLARLARLLGGRSDDEVATLPPGAGPLVGRQVDLARLDDEAASGGVVVVCGPGGVGKTALCLQWASTVRDRYPDGVLFVDLYGFRAVQAPLSRSDALRRLLFALGEDVGRLPEDADDLAGRYRAVTADRRLLVLLDDAGSSDQARALIPAGPGTTTLVTSRRRLDGLVAGDAARHLPLAPLDLADAVRLLTERGPGRLPPDRLAELAEACARLPLALVILGAHLQRHPDRVLRSTTISLDLLEVEDEDRSIRQLVDVTLRALPERARSTVDLLGLWPAAEFDSYGVAALLGSDRVGAVRLLDALTDLHLVEERHPDRYSMHDLVAGCLRERAAALPAAARDAATRRVYRYHLAVAARCADVLDQHRGRLPVDADPTVELPPLESPGDVVRWYSVAQPTLSAVIRQAQAEGAAPYSWQLPYAAATLFKRRGPRSEHVAQLEAAAAVVPVGDRFRPRVFNNLGVAHAMSGRLTAARACWEQALDAEVEPEGIAAYVLNLAVVDAELGDRDAALRGYERALDLRRSLDDPTKVANILVNLGRLRIDAGDLDGAAHALEEACRTGEDLGDEDLLGAALLELSRIRGLRRDPEGGLALVARG